MADSKPKVQRKRLNNDERRCLEAKRKKRYDTRRVYLGCVFDHWERQRRRFGRTHSEFAEHLLLLHSLHCTGCKARTNANRLPKLVQQSKMCLVTPSQTGMSDVSTLAVTTEIKTENGITKLCSPNIKSEPVDLSECSKNSTNEKDHNAQRQPAGQLIEMDQSCNQPSHANGSNLKDEIAPSVNTHGSEKQSTVRVQTTEKVHTNSHKTAIRLQTKSVSEKNKKYLCSYCSRSFKYLSTMMKHMISHKDEAPFCCSYCPKRYKYKNNLKHHEVVHADEKAYSCSDCGKRFSCEDSLNSHVKIHASEKPYSCLECNKRFSGRGKLAIHMAFHTSEKPYSCPECQRCFTEPVGLKQHMVDHNIFI